MSEHYPDSTPPIRAVAVLPFGGGQTLDIADLASLGLEKQADHFLNYANSLEEDRPGRTAITAVSVHNLGSAVLGFRLEPGTVSSTSRTQRGVRPGGSLESGAVLALAFVFVPAEHLARRAHCDDCGPVPEDVPDPYEFLVLETSTRWSRLTRPCAWSPYVAETARWNSAANLERAAALIEHFPRSRRRDHLEAQLASLSTMMLSAVSLVPLNDTRPAVSICVDSIQPKHGWWDQHTELTIRGCGFNGNVRAVTVGGVACDFKVANDRTLLIEVPPWGEVRKTEKSASDGTTATPSLTLSESGVAEVNLPQNLFHSGGPSGQVGPVEAFTHYDAQQLAELQRRRVCSESRLPDEDQKRLDALLEKRSSVENAWARVVLKADVVIAADVPVCSSVADQDDASGGGAAGIAGSIVFDKQLVRFENELQTKCPAVEPPQISVRYSPQGDHVVNVTTSGDPSGIAKLLEFLKEALKHEDEFSFELIAEGFKLTTEGLTKQVTTEKPEN